MAKQDDKKLNRGKFLTELIGRHNFWTRVAEAQKGTPGGKEATEFAEFYQVGIHQFTKPTNR